MTSDKTTSPSGSPEACTPVGGEARSSAPDLRLVESSDSELDGLLAALIAEVGKEDVPERIRALAEELGRALDDTRRER